MKAWKKAAACLAAAVMVLQAPASAHAAAPVPDVNPPSALCKLLVWTLIQSKM